MNSLTPNEKDNMTSNWQRQLQKTSSYVEQQDSVHGAETVGHEFWFTPLKETQLLLDELQAEISTLAVLL